MQHKWQDAEGSYWGPEAASPPAHPQLTHTVLAIGAELEACIADTLEAACCVDAAAVVAEATAGDALVHVWWGGRRAVSRRPPGPQALIQMQVPSVRLPVTPTVRWTAIPTHSCLVSVA